MRSLAVVLGALALAAPAHAASDDISIDVLSNRADVISGGDALVRVSRPSDAAGLALTVTVGDRDLTGKFGSDGVGLIDGLHRPDVAKRDVAVLAREHVPVLPLRRGAHVTPTWRSRARPRGEMSARDQGS